MLFQHRSLDVFIPDEPHLYVRIPSAFCRLRRLLQRFFRVGDLYRNKVAIGKFPSRRCPRRFIDDDFRGLYPHTARLIIPIAHADKCAAVYCEQPFRPLLARFQFQPRYHCLSLRMEKPVRNVLSFRAGFVLS